jgi:hypothetical protein
MKFHDSAECAAPDEDSPAGTSGEEKLRTSVVRRDCEIVEMACLKISCSWEPDSSNTENLSKLLIRTSSLAPLRR